MQIKNSFDKITQNKILRGALIASTGAFMLALLQYLGTVDMDNPLIASFFVILAPVATNAIKEYMAGE